MAIWIELRCENRDENSADGDGELHFDKRHGYHEKKCWSHVNYGLGELADDTAKSMNTTYSSIASQATACGWIKNRRGWICPHCASLNTPTPQEQ